MAMCTRLRLDDEMTLLTNNIFVNIIPFMNVKEAPSTSRCLAKPDLAALQVSAEKACALLKVMANTDRLVLLCRLAQGEFCVGELEEDLGIRQPTLSQQLTVLRNEGLVDTRRQGKQIYYRLISADAEAVMQVLHSRICGVALPSGVVSTLRKVRN
jgi:DNA-binding transcriptional ArsR family regulator